MADILIKYLNANSKKKVNRLELISKAIAQHATDLVDFGAGKGYNGINDLISLIKEADKLRMAIKSDLLYARSFTDFAKWVKKENWYAKVNVDSRSVVIQDVQDENELDEIMQDFQNSIKYTAVADWEWRNYQKTGVVTFG